MHGKCHGEWMAARRKKAETALAEYEREQISTRTKLALAAAKARGKKLGWAMPARRQEQVEASRRGVQSNVAGANRFAEGIAKAIELATAPPQPATGAQAAPPAPSTTRKRRRRSTAPKPAPVAVPFDDDISDFGR